MQEVRPRHFISRLQFHYRPLTSRNSRVLDCAARMDQERKIALSV